MFPGRMQSLEVRLSCRRVSSSRFLEDVAVLGECCSSSRDSSLKLIILVFVSGAVVLCQVDVACSDRCCAWQR